MTQCPICLEEPPNDPHSLTCSGHVFCRNCIAEWVSVNPTCPVTRQNVPEDEIVYFKTLVSPTRAESIFIEIERPPELVILTDSRYKIKLGVIFFCATFCFLVPLHVFTYLGLYIQSKTLVKYYSNSIPPNNSLACLGQKFTTFPFIPLTCSWLSNSVLFSFVHGSVQSVLLTAAFLKLREFHSINKGHVLAGCMIIMVTTIILQMTLFAGKMFVGGSVLSVLLATLNLKMNSEYALNLVTVLSTSTIIFSVVSDAYISFLHIFQLLYCIFVVNTFWGSLYWNDRAARVLYRTGVGAPVVVFLLSLITHFKYHIV